MIRNAINFFSRFLFSQQEQEQEQEQEKEKEKEEEKVDDIEEEEFIRQKYARDDEEPVPWSVEKLAHTPAGGSQGFYPLSKFSIFKNVIRNDDNLHFPEFLWLSKNHYNMQWTLSRTLRRLKNVIVVMEYEPSIKTDEIGLRTTMHAAQGGLGKVLQAVGLASGQFTIEQENILLRCFSMFVVDDDGKLTAEDIKHVSLWNILNSCFIRYLFVALFMLFVGGCDDGCG